MYPRSFDYLAPDSLGEALEMLSSHPGARILSGGMSLVPMLKLRLVAPGAVIDLRRIAGLDGIESHDDRVAIGALARHTDTAGHPLVRGNGAALAEAASVTGDAQIRNWGTTCGSMAHVDPAADQPAAALACDATLLAVSATKQRTIAAADFFVDAFTTGLEPDEILVGLHVPNANPGEASAYEKVGRRGGRSDFAVAGAAVWVRMASGLVTGARIALTGVGVVPTLARDAAERFVGTDGSLGAIARAAEDALLDVSVVDDLFASREFRSHLARLCVRHAAQRAVVGAQSS